MYGSFWIVSFISFSSLFSSLFSAAVISDLSISRISMTRAFNSFTSSVVNVASVATVLSADPLAANAGAAPNEKIVSNAKKIAYRFYYGPEPVTLEYDKEKLKLLKELFSKK